MILKNLGHLRTLMLEMEASLGLLDLSQGEKDVYYAISSLSDETGTLIRSEAIRNHPLVVDMPPASFHRALRGLVDRGFVKLAPERRAGAYVLAHRGQS